MNIHILQNTALSDHDTAGRTSTVGEPSVANNGQQILMTGNWYATKSLDNGATWQEINPFSFFPTAHGGFCCDQTVLYDSSRDLLFWILQYSNTDTGNTLRLAVKKGATLEDDNAWYWWDFVPSQVNQLWQNEWFDYNHATLSDTYLYIGTNVFRTANDNWTRSVVLRLPLDDLAAGAGLSATYFATTQNFSLRCTLGATNVMYFGSHNSNTQIRVYEWPEANNSVTFTDVNVSQWQGGNGYTALGPDGNNWLTRCDPRITGAWTSNGTIGFLWSVDKFATRPFPHIRAIRIDAALKQVIDEPDIWNPNYAYAYPETCPNIMGDVGITCFRGGGATLYPSHVVGFFDSATNNWKLKGTRNGTNGPSDGKWGDYLTCRRFAPNGASWLATGATLQGGATRDFIQPCLIHFAAD